MEEKYNNAIKAGIIGGVTLALYYLLQFILGYIPVVNFLVAVLACLLWPVILLVSVGIGAYGVKLASQHVKTLVDGIILGAVAGAVAGLISAVAQIIFNILSALLSSSTSDIVGSAIGVVFSGVCGSVAAVAIIVVAAILGAIGGALYTFLVLKIQA
ncbi:hypothetical protein [Methanocella arvoryzae]|uniref:DUF5518 domain-containing protein n=1 Tax=Methanocella arvoryzae (strain DSM 22066 / NBRC 105507 / MRE50) TaxID=351160 RepID=Q0W709_METAR|nr:hypothetical protein [Methanocella arvoryzae]CAJ35834.1 hypothetical protein RCIX394 [Methanocella arvoryzae MRE50]